jgi:hypothetical protein
VLNDTRDFALSPAELDGYQPYADDLRVELVTGAGHFLPEERPRLVAETAISFFSALTEPNPGDADPVEPTPGSPTLSPIERFASRRA